MNVKIDVSEDLNTYKSELNSLLINLEKELRKIAISDQPVLKTKFFEIKKNIDSCNTNISQIQVEVNSLPKKNQFKYNDLLTNYNNKINKLRKIYDELVITKQAFDDTKDNPKAALIRSGKYQTDSNNLIDNSIKNMRSVNSRDNTTLNMLSGQSDAINIIKNKLNETESVVLRTSIILKGMIRKIYMNRMALMSIIIMLGALILLVLFIKIKKGLGLNYN